MPPQLAPGERLDRYEIVREVSRGSYSSVYEANDTVLKKVVALRVLTHSEYVSHFLAAARQAASVHHPGTPAMFCVNEAQGLWYYSRKFVEGSDLRDRCSGKQPPLHVVSRMVSAVASVLDHAHRLGIIHGFVHPKHILVGRDESFWLIGFGEYPPPLPMLFGNPSHLAPEQFRNGDLTPATDVYGLAYSCVWVLRGGPPFASDTMTNILSGEAVLDLCRRLPDLHPEITPSVQRVLARGLHADTDSRYSSPGEFAAVLVETQKNPKPRTWGFWK